MKLNLITTVKFIDSVKESKPRRSVNARKEIDWGFPCLPTKGLIIDGRFVDCVQLDTKSSKITVTMQDYYYTYQSLEEAKEDFSDWTLDSL